MSLTERIRNGWNAFMGRDPTAHMNLGYSTTTPGGKVVLSRGAERTIVTAVYNRIAMDVAAVDLDHVKVDLNDNFKEPVMSKLRDVLRLSANIDQTGRELVQDAVLSMFDEGYVAFVPVDTTSNPVTGAFDILTLRTGQILEWYPSKIKVRVYNERDGQKRDLILPKSMVAIVVNPFYEIMNRPNSTLQRLIRKLALLDSVDEQSGTGKLDMIIQLPYVIKTESRREQAEKRRRDIETQLANSKYGIAYTDGTEHITQLNRSLENNLMDQIEYLTSMLYSQLGLSQSVFDGTADENTMNNYNTRTVVPILTAIVEEMTRKFLSKTAITQGQRIRYQQDPFRFVPITEVATIGDSLTRNEILSSNELRAMVGFRPVDDPKANELRNKNLNQTADAEAPASTAEEYGEEDAELPEEIQGLVNQHKSKSG